MALSPNVVPVAPTPPPSTSQRIQAAFLSGAGWFIPASVEGHLSLLRARLLVLLSFLSTGNAFFFMVLHGLHHRPGAGYDSLLTTAGLGLAAGALPFALRWTGRLRELIWVFATVVLAGLTLAAASDGGLDSGSVFWIVCSPAVAAFLGGARLGIAAAVGATVAMVALYAASAAGHTFDTDLLPEYVALHQVLNAALASTLLVALAALYEGPMVQHFRELSSRLAAANASLQDELLERQRAQRQAESASQAKDVLLGNMSHEFRTPLTMIIGSTERLLDRADESARPALESIDRGAQRLLGTLDGVLDLTSIQSGGVTLRPAPTDVTAAVRRAVQGFQEAAEHKGIALEARGLRVTARVDRDALDRIVSAVLDNAVRFTDRGRVVVVVWDDDGPVIEVSDTGAGMSPAVLAKATEPFHQGDRGAAIDDGRLGLGLTTAHRLVELMGGRLSITSAVNHGTVVRLRLPPAPSIEIPSETAAADA